MCSPLQALGRYCTHTLGCAEARPCVGDPVAMSDPQARPPPPSYCPPCYLRPLLISIIFTYVIYFIWFALVHPLPWTHPPREGKQALFDPATYSVECDQLDSGCPNDGGICRRAPSPLPLSAPHQPKSATGPHRYRACCHACKPEARFRSACDNTIEGLRQRTGYYARSGGAARRAPGAAWLSAALLAALLAGAGGGSG